MRSEMEYCRNVLPEIPLSRESFPSDGARGFFIDRAQSAWKKTFIQRPAAYRLLEAVRPGDHIVMYSIDRGFRNVADFATTTSSWLKRGINIHYICDGIDTTTATGRLRANLLASVAQYYSDIISERTREALAIKRITDKPDKVKLPAPKSIWIPGDTPYLPLHTVSAQPRPGSIYCYERVSHISSYISGLGLECQSLANQRYAQYLASTNLGLTIHTEPFVDEAISAFKVPLADRPAGRKLLEILKPGDHVVIYRLDRAWRQPGEAAIMAKSLADRGVCVHFVEDKLRTDTQHGLDYINILASVASLESSMKSRRAKEVAAHCREQGRPCGNPRYQYKIVKRRHVKKIVICQEKLTWMAMCWMLYNHTDYGVTRSSDIINAIWSSEQGCKALPLAFRKTIGYNTVAVRNLSIRFEQLLADELPKSLLRKCVDNALSKLRREPPASHRIFCKRIGWPLTLDLQAIDLILPQTYPMPLVS